MSTPDAHAELLTDVRWLLDELGVDHWRGCDDTDCYQCEGYQEIRARWADTETMTT